MKNLLFIIYTFLIIGFVSVHYEQRMSELQAEITRTKLKNHATNAKILKQGIAINEHFKQCRFKYNK